MMNMVKEKKEKEKRQICIAIKRSLWDIGKEFSQGADKVADILLESGKRAKSAKVRKLKEEITFMVKQIKSSFKKVRPKDVLRDASYRVGRFVSVVETSFSKFFNGTVK